MYLLKANLQNLKHCFKVIAITETGNRTFNQIESTFPNYNVEFLPPKMAKGGVAILVKKNEYDIVERITSVESSCVEYETIWVKLKKGTETNILSTIYRHPNTDPHQFIGYLEEVNPNIIQMNKLFILSGDLNIDLIKINDPITAKYIELLMSNNVIPCIYHPTRITNISASALDHICMYRPKHQVNISASSGSILVDISDHLNVFIILNWCIKRTKRAMNRKKIRIFSHKNIEQFKNNLNDNDWSPVYDSNNSNESFTRFHTTYKHIYEKSFPLVTQSRTAAKMKSWLTKGLLVSVKHKNRLYHKVLQKPSNESLRLRYNMYKKQLQKALEWAEKEYYTKQLLTEKSNIKNLWAVYSDILGKNRKKDGFVKELQVDGKSYNDNSEISNQFNKYFANIGKIMASSFESTKEYSKYLGESNNNSMFLEPVNKSELFREIMQLNPNKSAGLDNISPKIIKASCDYIIGPLLHTFNLSFASGIFPDVLKVAKTIPIF